MCDFGVSNTLIQQGLIESDTKDIYVTDEVKISNKRCSFGLSIHQRILKQMYQDFQKNTKQQNC